MPSLSLPRLAGIYLRIGSLTFGGGDPTMAALQAELVVRRRWLPPEKYGLVYALARITPGTNMLAFCAGTAWELMGWPAAIAAVFGATVPAAILVTLLTTGYDALQGYPRAMAAAGGTLAAAVGMMFTGAWQLLAPHLLSRRAPRVLRGLVIFAASLVLAFRFQMPPIQVLALAALAGFFWQAPPKA